MKKLTILLLFLATLLLTGCIDGGHQETGKDNGKEVSKKQNKQEKESGSGEKLVEENEEEAEETEQNEKETEKGESEKKESKDSGEEETESGGQIKAEEDLFKLSKTKNGKYSYTITGKTSKDFYKVQVIWENDDGERDEPYTLSSYNSGDNSFEYNIKPEFNNINYGENKYMFEGIEKNGKKYTGSLSLNISDSKKK